MDGSIHGSHMAFSWQKEKNCGVLLGVVPICRSLMDNNYYVGIYYIFSFSFLFLIS